MRPGAVCQRWPVVCLMALACGDGPKHVLFIIYPYMGTTPQNKKRKGKEQEERIEWEGRANRRL